MSDDVKDEKVEEQKSTESTEKSAESTSEEVKEEKVEEKVEEKSLDDARDKKEEKKEEEKPAEEPKEEKKPEPSGKFKDLIKTIEELSVLELAELVKELENRFGVSAAAPVAMAAVGVPAAGGDAGGGEEKTSYTVHLADAGSQKIAVIKAIRTIRQDLGLKEAKDLVDGAPKDVKADVPKEEAEAAKKAIEEAGGKVELK